jgi:predicted nucleic-acid-binding protein
LKGVDSSVLLRYILADDPKWTSAAVRFIDEECTADDPGYVNLVVLVETIWSLRRMPGVGKATIMTIVRELLDSQSLVIEREAVVSEALISFESADAGFVDCLIANLNNDAQATPTYSLDKDAIKNGVFSGLSK